MKDQVKAYLLPKIQKALESGDYEFTSKNSLRIYVLEVTPYSGEVEPSGLKEANIRFIEIGWTE